MKTGSYKVTPSCGAYEAPSLYVDASDARKAAVAGREKSGLSRFNNWVFHVKFLESTKKK